MDSEVRSPYQDEIRIKDLVRSLKEHRIAAALFVAVCTAVIGVLAFVLQRKYDAVIMVSPVSSSAEHNFGTSGSMMGGALSGLAALAGLNVGADSKKAESMATLQSEALTERYIRENKLLPVLYSDLWDAGRKGWKTTDPQKTPTLWKANQYFKRAVRTISQDAKTGMVTVTIRWTDPATAAQWANGLVKMANDYLREIALAEADRNITYLTEQAGKTDAVEVKQATYMLLQSELSKAMIARGTEEYAFRVIDPAVPPERAAYPQRLIWILGAFLGSCLLAVFIAFCHVAWQKG
ncbi:MAG: hypothetical protein JOZ12_10890 [Sinobacteraceae bacterium]|nr:hypothetical protein [Nevskiaceae bacterium]